MTPTLRAELDRIEDFLMGPEGLALASILSGLRGPDNGSEKEKLETTVHIRRKAFPRMVTASTSVNPYTSAQMAWALHTVYPFKMPDNCISHFSSHVRSAAARLDLKDGDKP